MLEAPSRPSKGRELSIHLHDFTQGDVSGMDDADEPWSPQALNLSTLKERSPAEAWPAPGASAQPRQQPTSGAGEALGLWIKP